MTFVDFYYRVKPAIPHSLRLRLRSYFAAKNRRRSEGHWPIDESTGRRPDWWPGWPEQRSFAFVLTHDVEGKKGVQRSRSLAELEMAAGFRSCFNFVPEGSYETPPALRTFLAENGFEVGVHDLHHDGTLYRSKDEFNTAAKRINQHLE